MTKRDRGVRRTLWAVLVLNLAVAAAKLAVGWMVGAISMVADGFHSLTDGASNVVGLIGTSVARKPPDEDHPYGHRRFETLAALLIGALLAMTAWEVLQSCIERLVEGGAPDPTPVAFGVMVVTMAINLAVSTYEHRKGRELESEILHADATHTRSDVYTSLAVLISLGAARIGYPQVDLVAALMITAVIGRAAFRILREHGMALTDQALLPAAAVREVALKVPEVESVHKIRSRGGAAGGHVDLHVQLPSGLPLEEAHAIGHQVADLIREELGLGDVLVHVEPESVADRSEGGEGEG